MSARISGHGSSRTLSWRLRAVPGQRVRFVEQGPDVNRVLATTNLTSGRVHFRPAFGSRGTRTVVALVAQNGMPRDSITVAHYTAPPPPRPDPPRRLRARRRGAVVDVA